MLSTGPAISVNPDHPAIHIAAEAFAQMLGRKNGVSYAVAGPIPIVGEFARHLGIPTVLMGFGLPDDGLHSPNEKIPPQQLLRRDPDDCTLPHLVR